MQNIWILGFGSNQELILMELTIQKQIEELIKGDILSLNTFPMISGYYTALERTLFLDHADDDSLKAWEANVKVHKRGLELNQTRS